MASGRRFGLDANTLDRFRERTAESNEQRSSRPLSKIGQSKDVVTVYSTVSGHSALHSLGGRTCFAKVQLCVLVRFFSH